MGLIFNAYNAFINKIKFLYSHTISSVSINSHKPKEKWLKLVSKHQKTILPS